MHTEVILAARYVNDSCIHGKHYLGSSRHINHLTVKPLKYNLGKSIYNKHLKISKRYNITCNLTGMLRKYCNNFTLSDAV